MRRIEETSTITAKGQTTVPKAVRQALGVGCGGKISFRIEGGRVTVHNPEDEDRDPALAAFLGLIEKDIAAGRNIGDLPPRLIAEMRRAIKEVPINLDEELEADAKPRREVATLRARAPNRKRRGGRGSP